MGVAPFIGYRTHKLTGSFLFVFWQGKPDSAMMIRGHRTLDHIFAIVNDIGPWACLWSAATWRRFSLERA